MPAPQRILDLVKLFDRNADEYRSSDFKEAQLRIQFVNPMFKALGWDMENEQGHAEAYKDVIHEASLKIGDESKAPDYCFRIGGTPKFYLEAKKPFVNVKEDPVPAFQLRRYAWNPPQMPLSILTDFEEFAVYDGRIKPSQHDKASVARVTYMRYTEYADKWDEIAAVFSRDAILKGSFDKYAESSKKKRGTAPFDSAFLDEIEGWRLELAKNFALRNSTLSSRELNYAVQITIDRIIFLRMCEDRGIEPYGQLRDLTDVKDIYGGLFALFRQADARYNSGLFHFENEKGRAEGHDELTPWLKLDDKVLKPILGRLYYPESPYLFSKIPPEILGQVYEQFLGRVIRLTAGHLAKVEPKPEVKKAGGVYYTPTYIVDYIVQHTVGKLLNPELEAKLENAKREGTANSLPTGDRVAALRNYVVSANSLTPKQAAKLRILDPACGSGSFLLGAYQYLLDWHLAYYLHHEPAKWDKELFKDAQGEWRLTTQEKKRILRNNIYGVDIDPQAVEVTKLSLLLKVLEGETQETIYQQRRLFHERVLPDLASNIKCGNSLIGPDFYDEPTQGDLWEDEEERVRINVFDWGDQFSDIMNVRGRGGPAGFDAVIGNPPYLNIDDTWGSKDPRLGYIRRTYQEVYNDKTDILFYFLAKAVQLSRDHVGFIVSRAFLEAYKADKLREWIPHHTNLRRLIDLQNFYVFPGVGITTAILLLSKTHETGEAIVLRLRRDSLEPSELNDHAQSAFERLSVATNSLGGAAWIFARPAVETLLKRIDKAGHPLGSILVIGQGMQTGENKVFGGFPPEDIKSVGLKEGSIWQRARNSDVQRYRFVPEGEYLLYLEEYARFEDLPKAVRTYLSRHADELKGRAAFKRGDCEWWKYTWPLHKEFMPRAKMYCPYLAPTNRFALDEEGQFLGLTDTTVLFEKGQPESMHYLLAVLNSRLLSFRFRYIGKLKSGGIFEYFWNSISKLPIRRIEMTSEKDRKAHDRLVNLELRP